MPREERERGFAELTEAMRRKLDQSPGLAYIFEQPIANRLAEMLTGAEGDLSVKLPSRPPSTASKARTCTRESG